MKVHFIAIGGSAMHNLAIALKNKGYEVTGSDDAIFEPSKTRLEQKGILPKEFGWFPEKITANIDAVILGMHAHADNPELARAKELGLKIYSYPEFLYQQSKEKNQSGNCWFTWENHHHFYDSACADFSQQGNRLHGGRPAGRV